MPKKSIKSKKSKSRKNNAKPPIIHITGASGAGKTTMGYRLIDYYKDKIVMYDVDKIVIQFKIYTYGTNETDRFDKKLIEDYIYKLIKDIKVPIIFIGLNAHGRWISEHTSEYEFFNVYSTHNFFIDIDEKTLLRQKCHRFLENVRNIYINTLQTHRLLNKNKVFINNIGNTLLDSCELERIVNMNQIWFSYYKKNKYKFLPAESIHNSIKVIIDKVL